MVLPLSVFAGMILWRGESKEQQTRAKKKKSNVRVRWWKCWVCDGCMRSKKPCDYPSSRWWVGCKDRGVGWWERGDVLVLGRHAASCAGEERERTLPPAGKARAGHGTLTSFLAAAAAVFVADVVGRGGKGLETCGPT